MFNIGKKLGMYFLAGSFVFAFAGAAMAQHGHGGMDMSTHASSSPSMPMKDRTVQSESVDGYKITLDVMDMSMHMSMQGMKGNPMKDADHSKSHAFMVTIQDTASKEIISDAKIIYTLISPSGEKRNR